MLKADLEKRVKELEAEKASYKQAVSDLCNEVLEECCDTSHPHVKKLAEIFDITPTVGGAIEFDIELPIELMNNPAYELEEDDFKLTYKGKEIKIREIDSIHHS